MTVGASARLTECIVADGAVIPPGATYERCAIVPAGRRHAASGERANVADRETADRESLVVVNRESHRAEGAR